MQHIQQGQSNTMSMDIMPATQAVEALIHDYGRLVFQVIYGLTGDWQESQDLTQDTFLQALRAIEAAQQASGAHFHAKAWLLQIAVNTVRMHRRRFGNSRQTVLRAQCRTSAASSWVYSPGIRLSLPVAGRMRSDVRAHVPRRGRK